MRRGRRNYTPARAGRLLVVRGGAGGRVVGRDAAVRRLRRRAGAWHSSSRDPVASAARRRGRAAAMAVALLGVHEFSAAGTPRGRRVADRRRRGSRPSASACRRSLFAIAWNTRAAGGSDSSCYVLQAEAFAQGRAHARPPLSELSCPACRRRRCSRRSGSFRRRAARRGGARFARPDSRSLMVRRPLVQPRRGLPRRPRCSPRCSVWCTFLLGRAVDDEVTGRVRGGAAGVQPDLSLSGRPADERRARRGAVARRACSAAAVGRRGRWIGDGGRRSPADLRVAGRPDASERCAHRAAAPGCCCQWLRALACGSVAGGGCRLAAVMAASTWRAVWLAAGVRLWQHRTLLFSLAHVAPNLARYPRWLLETHTPFVAARGWRRRWLFLAQRGQRGWRWSRLSACRADARDLSRLHGVRRLVVHPLPAAGAACDARVRRDGHQGGAAMADAVVGVMGADDRRRALSVAGRPVRSAVFDCSWSRFRAGSTRRALPANASSLRAAAHRYYGGVDAAWDASPERSISVARVAVARSPAATRRVALPAERASCLVGAAERQPAVPRRPRHDRVGRDSAGRARSHDRDDPIGGPRAVHRAGGRRGAGRSGRGFATQRSGRLDWPPQVEIHAPVRVRFYDPAALERYLAGERVDTGARAPIRRSRLTARSSRIVY